MHHFNAMWKMGSRISNFMHSFNTVMQWLYENIFRFREDIVPKQEHSFEIKHIGINYVALLLLNLIAGKNTSQVFKFIAQYHVQYNWHYFHIYRIYNYIYIYTIYLCFSYDYLLRWIVVIWLNIDFKPAFGFWLLNFNSQHFLKHTIQRVPKAIKVWRYISRTRLTWYDGKATPSFQQTQISSSFEQMVFPPIPSSQCMQEFKVKDL